MKKGITLTNISKGPSKENNSGFIVKGKRYDSAPRNKRVTWGGNKLPPRLPKRGAGNKENDKSSLNRLKSSIFSPKKKVEVIKINPLLGDFKRLRQV